MFPMAHANRADDEIFTARVEHSTTGAAALNLKAAAVRAPVALAGVAAGRSHYARTASRAGSQGTLGLCRARMSETGTAGVAAPPPRLRPLPAPGLLGTTRPRRPCRKEEGGVGAARSSTVPLHGLGWLSPLHDGQPSRWFTTPPLPRAQLPLCPVSCDHEPHCWPWPELKQGRDRERRNR